MASFVCRIVIPRQANSDHPSTATGGPAWVGSVFNALTTSKQYQNDFALIVVWDDWGGLFDHVPDTSLTKLPLFPANHPNDPYEYGYRVPLMAIGPYAKRGFVDHTQRNFTAIVHFIERVFGLPSLGQLDAQTDDLFGMFNFANGPSRHGPIPTGDMTIEKLLQLPPDPTPVDDD
jgi:phospholipase C